EFLQLLADPPGDLDHAAESSARAGVEVQDRIVGALQRGYARVPGVVRDRAELHRVEERREVTADEPPLVTVAEPDIPDAHTRRHAVGRRLLVERLAVDAVRIAFKDERAVVH